MFVVLALTLAAPVAPPPRLVGEFVELKTPTGTLHGTLDLPSGTGPWPVVLLHAGSGPTDRDGNQAQLRNDSLKLLGRGLAARGIAVLRIDKRGVGASSTAPLKEEDLRFETYANDAAAWLGWLRADGRFTKIGVVGHSEGALIGALAAKTAKADAFVSLCGAGRPAGDVLREQLAANLPEKLRSQSETILAELEAGRSVKDVPKDLVSLYRPSVQPYLISWLLHDPAKAIAALDIPMLIIDGTTDIQIPLTEGERLGKAKPAAKRLTFENMNHVLKEVSTTNRIVQLLAYTDPSRPLHPKLVEEVSEFLLKALGGK